MSCICISNMSYLSFPSIKSSKIVSGVVYFLFLLSSALTPLSEQLVLGCGAVSSLSLKMAGDVFLSSVTIRVSNTVCTVQTSDCDTVLWVESHS